MAKLDEKKILTNPTRQVIFNCLMEGENLKKAAQEAKRSYQYVRRLATESNITELVLQKKAEIGVKVEDRLEKRLKQLDDLIDDKSTKPATRLKAIDLQGKMCGWHSMTTNLEVGSRQRELSQAERAEAQQLALMRFNSGSVIDAEVVSDSQQDETESALDLESNGKSE